MSQKTNRGPLAHNFWAIWEKTWWLFAILFFGGFIYLAVTDTDLLIKILSLIFLMAGIATLIHVDRMRRQQKASITWRPAQGRILSSQVASHYPRA